MRRRPAILLVLASAAALGILGASPLPWSDMTPADWIYAVATRFTAVDGHTVHYPTPTAELAKLLEGRKEAGAWRHLAEARMGLGDRAGALAALEQWCAAEGAASPGAGAEAWAETARWAAEHLEMAAAFRAAEKALPGLRPEAKLALSKERIAWAMAHVGVRGGRHAVETLAHGQSAVAPVARMALERLEPAATDDVSARAPVREVTVNRAFSRRFFEALERGLPELGKGELAALDASSPMELLDENDLLSEDDGDDDEVLDDIDLVDD